MELALFRRTPQPPPWMVLGEGIAAGLAGTAVMTAAQTRVIPRLPIPRGPEPRKNPTWPDELQAQGEPATETAARRLVEGLARRSLTPRQKKRAGNLLHFTFGAAWGGLFALFVPRPTPLQGLAFGALVWMTSDNGLLPLLRIGSVPTRYPPGVHARALLAHLFYGVGTAWALRLAHDRVER